MKFFDNPEEIFIGAVLQFPLYFIVGWWVLPIMLICGLLWRYGGMSGGYKIARWLGVPVIVCVSAFVVMYKWPILLAIPFMVKLAPSYGIDSWLFKLTKSDFITRILCYAWYWGAFLIFFRIS